MWVVCVFCFLIYWRTFSQNHSSSHSLSSQVNTWFSRTVDITLYSVDLKALIRPTVERLKTAQENTWACAQHVKAAGCSIVLLETSPQLSLAFSCKRLSRINCTGISFRFVCVISRVRDLIKCFGLHRLRCVEMYCVIYETYRSDPSILAHYYLLHLRQRSLLIRLRECRDLATILSLHPPAHFPVSTSDLAFVLILNDCNIITWLFGFIFLCNKIGFHQTESVYFLPKSLIPVVCNKPKLHNIITCLLLSPKSLTYTDLIRGDLWPMKQFLWSIVLFYDMMDENNNILHPCLFLRSFNGLYV